MTVLLQFVADNAAWIYAICALTALWYIRVVLRARHERKQAVFALEREAALQRVFNALGVAISLLIVMGVTYFISRFVVPKVTELVGEETIAATTPIIALPTLETPTPTPTPTPTATPIPTPRPRPTLRPLPSTPEPTAPPVTPPSCPNPAAKIASPGQNQVIVGAVTVMGTASIPNIDYYKLEFRPAGSSQEFSYITGRKSPADGVLGVWDTSPLPAGAYTLRLVVVDITGNYPPPCEVTVQVAH